MVRITKNESCLHLPLQRLQPLQPLQPLQHFPETNLRFAFFMFYLQKKLLKWLKIYS